MNKPDNQPPLAAEAIKPAETVKPEPPTVKPAEAAQPVPPVAKPVAAVKPVTPAVKLAEAAQPVPPVVKPIEAVKPVTPAAKPAEVVKPVPPVVKPIEAVKPVTPAVKPAEVVKPVPPVDKPVEAVKPVPPVAKPVEAVKPVSPVVKPIEAVQLVTPAVKPAEVVKPVPPVVKPVEAVKPVPPAAKPAEAVNPVTPAVKPAEVVKPVPPAAKPAEAVKPVPPAAKPAVKPIDTAKPTMNEANIANKPPKKTAKLNTKLSSLGGVLKGHRLLLLLVILPFLVAVLYLGVLAKDRYVSESMVVVKRADDMNIGNLSLGSLLTGGGASTKEDALLLQQYIMSPDMLQKLDAKLDFKTAFANSGWDVLQRLPQSASFEDYLAYYQDKVAVVFDEKNAVLHITTQGFDAEFAQQFNQAVLTESERFINELSHKINREEMLFANQEINRSYGQLQQAKETLLAYQNENNLVDPQVQIEATSRIVAELQTKQAQLEAELTNQLTYLNDDTPQIKAARSAIASIKQQIDKERATLTSSDNEQLNQKMFEFEELKAKVAFEGDLYKLSLAALEKSRVEAARKAKSLATISQPYLAEDARYPRRWYMLLTVFLVSLLVYGLSKVTLSIIEDHKI